MTARDEPLFVFEMANNHMGSLAHGLRIIDEIHAVCKDFSFQFGLKLQYRHLDSLIHPDYQTRTDLKYIKRFQETRLTADELRQLKSAAESAGFVTICTPFDEASVDLIEEHGFDMIKVASCSLTDWPLLERIARTERPVIASTAGAALAEIDKVVSFLEHRGKTLTLLHCVAEYPTPAQRLNLNQIDLLRERYPGVRIGYSTHEDPEQMASVQVAIGKGATVFEKHVGVATPEWPLNTYSAGPQQVGRWLAAAADALAMCGVRGVRSAPTAGERASLRSLARGAFAGRAVAKGERILPADVFLAMPTLGDQLTAESLSKYVELYALEDIAPHAPLMASAVRSLNVREKVYAIVQRVKELVRTSGVVVPSKADLEISHHYGIDRFDEYGMTMLTVVNRGYCKKILVLLPGQSHPEQYHRSKEETFHVLFGDLRLSLDGVTRPCHKGDVVLVEPGVKHSFNSASGTVLEEVSATHRPDDSFYTDPAIAQNEHRKSLVTYWLD
jgi:sialic acid synthase SpsE/mannose-6-phosphate isomerase-like protein (cupin superfamily)